MLKRQVKTQSEETKTTIKTRLRKKKTFWNYQTRNLNKL